MNTGDIVIDGRKRRWQVGETLGRGLWGSSWLVRDESGAERVLKVALRSEDFPADAPLPEGLTQTCATCVREQAKLLKAAEHPSLARLEDSFDLPDGRPAILMPRYASTLQKKIGGGLPLSQTLEIVVRVCRLLEDLGRSGKVHGNLRPSNILMNDRGEPILADLVTQAARERLSRLRALATGRRDYTPPEADSSPLPVWDTWALCVAMYESSMALGGTDPRHGEKVALPKSGLSKVELATLRDRALDRLKRESANPRFVNRAAEKLGALLSRGISAETEPSPPYRFVTPQDLRSRVAEVSSLIHPKIETVGKLLLAAHARDEVFQSGEEAQFSVTVGATDGVSGHEHIACGLQIFDLDAEDEGRIPVPEAKFDVLTHPSGRLRFQFALPDLAPGRYGVKVAFAVKDSGDDPQVASGEFEVRPPPGYVPPADEQPVATPSPIPFPAKRAAEPGPVDHFAEDVDAVPTPIAPSSPGTLDEDPEPPWRSPDPPMLAAVPTPAPSEADSDDLSDDLSGDLSSIEDDEPPVRRPPLAVVPQRRPADDTAISDPDAPPPGAVEGRHPSAAATVSPVVAIPSVSAPILSAPPMRTPAPVAVPKPGPLAAPTPRPAPAPAHTDPLDDAEPVPFVPGPAATEDLPEWDDSAPRTPDVWRQYLDRAFEIVRRDAWVAYILAVVGILAFVVISLACLKAIF